jgi:hypothetical protein
LFSALRLAAGLNFVHSQAAVLEYLLFLGSSFP